MRPGELIIVTTTRPTVDHAPPLVLGASYPVEGRLTWWENVYAVPSTVYIEVVKHHEVHGEVLYGSSYADFERSVGTFSGSISLRNARPDDELFLRVLVLDLMSRRHYGDEIPLRIIEPGKSAAPTSGPDHP